MSMIGLRLFHAIDERLRKIRPQFRDKPFGGISVILFGDFAQLPPVADLSLYQIVINKSPTVQHASQIYRESFTRAFHLTQQMRQQELDNVAIKFQNALSHLRSGGITKDDWEFFQSKVLTNLPPQAQQEFDDSIILYSTNREVIETNISMLEKVGTPVARIEAQYHGISTEAGASVDSDHCNGLEHVLHLSVGCRVYSLP